MDSTKIVIPDELFVVAGSSSFSGTLDLPVLKAGPDLYDFLEPLSWQVFISNTGEEALLVSGTVEGRARTSCVRCLEPFELDLFGEVEGYFLLNDPGKDLPDDMAEDEFEVIGDDDTIDLEPLIIAALRLELPLVPLCSEDCKGICPKCGKNLNEGPCDCVDEDGDETEDVPQNPFSVLKDLHIGEDN